MSVVAPSTPAPIDLNATPVAGGLSSGGASKRARQTSAGVLPDARSLFEEMSSAIDEDYMQNLMRGRCAGRWLRSRSGGLHA